MKLPAGRSARAAAAALLLLARAAAAEDAPAAADAAPAGGLFLITAPVVDLRRDPRPVPESAALRQPYEMDPFQETQLLFGEQVRVVERQGVWARVEAVEQTEYTHNKVWEGYPGWVRLVVLFPRPEDYAANAVVVKKYARLYGSLERKDEFVEIPLGARLSVVAVEKGKWARVRLPWRDDGWIALRDLRRDGEHPKDEQRLRESILKTAKAFLDEPYYWGGRSSHKPDELDRPTGVDCSALVHLAYRANGVDVPRDSHEQYLKSRPVFLSELRSGDLIFLAKTSNPNSIVHVMIYVGADQVVEAVHEFNTVRFVTIEEKLGVPLAKIGPLEAAGDRIVYLGRLLPDEAPVLPDFPEPAPPADKVPAAPDPQPLPN